MEKKPLNLIAIFNENISSKDKVAQALEAIKKGANVNEKCSDVTVLDLVVMELLSRARREELLREKPPTQSPKAEQDLKSTISSLQEWQKIARVLLVKGAKISVNTDLLGYGEYAYNYLTSHFPNLDPKKYGHFTHEELVSSFPKADPKASLELFKKSVSRYQEFNDRQSDPIHKKILEGFTSKNVQKTDFHTNKR